MEMFLNYGSKYSEIQANYLKIQEREEEMLQLLNWLRKTQILDGSANSQNIKKYLNQITLHTKNTIETK